MEQRENREMSGKSDRRNLRRFRGSSVRSGPLLLEAPQARSAPSSRIVEPRPSSWPEAIRHSLADASGIGARASHHNCGIYVRRAAQAPPLSPLPSFGTPEAGAMRDRIACGIRTAIRAPRTRLRLVPAPDQGEMSMMMVSEYRPASAPCTSPTVTTSGSDRPSRVSGAVTGTAVRALRSSGCESRLIA